MCSLLSAFGIDFTYTSGSAFPAGECRSITEMNEKPERKVAKGKGHNHCVPPRESRLLL